MNYNEIQEGNKLIAEFMGLKTEIHHKSLRVMPQNITPLDITSKSFMYFIHNQIEEELWYCEPKFDTSWDWLMPVVEKIEDYGYIVYIKQEICYIRNKTNSIKNLVYMCHYPKITAVFMVVVEFIKWYNNERNSN